MPQDPVPVTGIWLFKENDHCIVSAEINGEWRRLISEHVEGPFSHIIEPPGMIKAPLETGEELTPGNS